MDQKTTFLELWGGAVGLKSWNPQMAHLWSLPKIFFAVGLIPKLIWVRCVNWVLLQSCRLLKAINAITPFRKMKRVYPKKIRFSTLQIITRDSEPQEIPGEDASSTMQQKLAPVDFPVPSMSYEMLFYYAGWCSCQPKWYCSKPLCKFGPNKCTAWCNGRRKIQFLNKNPTVDERSVERRTTKEKTNWRSCNLTR